jgi:hypothetical protein
MFSIDPNALNRARFVVHPLKPINLSTQLDNTEVDSPGDTTHLSDVDTDSNHSHVQSEDDEPDVWTVKTNEGIAKNLVRNIAVRSELKLTRS